MICSNDPICADHQPRLIEALAAAHIASPRDHAREIMLLMEGAMIRVLIHGDRGYAKVAARPAKALAQKSCVE